MKKNIASVIVVAVLLICLPAVTACGGSSQTPAPESTQGHIQQTQMQTDDTIVLPDGHAIQPEYPLNEVSVGRAMTKFQYLYDSYLKDTDSAIYAAIVPDKGYYLQDTDLPTLDYEQLFQLVQEGMPYATHVDLTDTLSLDAYYYTDIHWRQEYLWDAAARLCEALGVTAPQPEDYTQTILQPPFYGMYYDEELAMGSDTILLLENELINSCTVTHHDTGRVSKVYDRTKMNSQSLYDVYLSGATPLLTIQNPQAATDRELIVFRDSFASSMVPLLLQDYATVTLVDIRYVSSAVIHQWVDFHGQDVLFLYSTLLINNSAAMK